MRQILVLAALFIALPAGAVEIAWVYVGDPGNPPDTAINCLNDAADCGSLSYAYAISKYEVTNAQYAEFLNAVAATDTYGLYKPSMGTDPIGGIARSGSSGSYTYAVKSGQGNNPVVFVNWYNAVRFANWLHNGRPTGPQGAGTTENGAYTLTGATSISGGRQPGALVFLPTENEWYKAAYYEAATTTFFDYPTGSNTAPTSEPPPGGSNSANFHDPVTGFAVTGSTVYSSTTNYLTDVGAYTSSPSPYGTYDQGGNAGEWIETETETESGSFRGHAGGNWSDYSSGLAASNDYYNYPWYEWRSSGFRVASVVPVPDLCGNGHDDPYEMCDDGNLVSGDGCDINCTPSQCGNGIAGGQETCDDGNTEPADGCSPTCQLEICGNGILDPGEDCDDGDVVSGDGCDANCTPTGCGNGIVTAAEQCDDGNDVAGDGCDPNCTLTGCGNAVITPPEQCDDGDAISGDGCDINCTTTACGNGVATAGEVCDDGDLVSNDGCDSNCTPTACGNGIVTLGEQCDDGNNISGDGCDADCQFTRCGNGVPDDPEECDDGNNISGDGCDADCTFTGCGNSIQTAGEACDDGNAIEDDGCDSTCEENFGTQTRTQAKCILNVNKGIARVARTQAEHNEKCLRAGAAFDECLETDPNGKITRAKQDLQKLERNKCLATEPPEFALGSDRLSGSPAASAVPVRLVRDLLGDPPTAASKSDRKAARCQTQTLQQANKLFDAIWQEIRAAKTDALKGRGTDAVVSNEQLGEYIQEMLSTSPSVKRATDRLDARIRGACGQVENLATIPGCDVASAGAVAACVSRAARCRACQLLLEADPRLTIDCDAFDNGVLDLSCGP